MDINTLIINAIVAALTALFVSWLKHKWEEDSVKKRIFNDHEHQLKMSLVKERVEKYSEAYDLWLDMLWAITGNDKEKLRKKAGALQDWWQKNMLYLDSESRKELKKSTIRAVMHENFSKESNQDKNYLMKNILDIENVGELLEKGVGFTKMKIDQKEREEFYKSIDSLNNSEN